MFRHIEEASPQKVTITFDGQKLSAREGDTIAAALLVSGLRSMRSTKVSGQRRAPYCMMGACFECLVEIDGETVQACMVSVKAEMTIRRVPGKHDD